MGTGIAPKVDGEFPPTPYPIVPGHEAAGTVVAVGAQVANVRVGDRVAIDPSLFCGSCKYCRAGRGNLCEHWGATGDTVDGALAEYVSVPARNSYTLPDEMSFSSAAMVEPVSCAVHAVDRLGVVMGASVLVVGAGTMGLVLGQLLGHAGARKVSFVDTNPAKLKLARSFGFEECYATLEEAVEAHGRYERVVEATGVALVAERAIDAVARGGTLMIFGVAPSGALARYRPFAVYNDEISIVGSMAVLSSYAPTTRASPSVLVNTAEGTVCVAGDIVSSLESFTDLVPCGINTSAGDALAAIEKIRLNADRLFMSHDLALTKCQRAGFPEVPKLATGAPTREGS